MAGWIAQARVLAVEGFSAPEIAERVERSQPTVRHALRDMPLSLRPGVLVTRVDPSVQEDEWERIGGLPMGERSADGEWEAED